LAKGFKDEDGKFHPTRDAVPKGSVKSSDIRIEGSETRIDPQKAEELRSEKSKDLVLHGDNAYWRISIEGNEYNLRLDDPIGWSWSGEKDSLLGFLARINHSKAKSDFLSKSSQLDFDEIKKILVENADDKDALWEVTGDNNTWGSRADSESQIDASAEFSSFYDDVSEESTINKGELESTTWGNFNYDYDDFVKSNYGEYAKKDLQKAVKESKDFEDLFDRLDKEDQGFRENAFYYISGEFQHAIQKSAKELGIKVN
jgi:hypothetical protein